ncbi:hypothetical protein IWQ60_012447, partial [Tieghemiomyces parasiticus]
LRRLMSDRAAAAPEAPTASLPPPQAKSRGLLGKLTRARHRPVVHVPQARSCPDLLDLPSAGGRLDEKLAVPKVPSDNDLPELRAALLPAAEPARPKRSFLTLIKRSPTTAPAAPTPVPVRPAPSATLPRAATSPLALSSTAARPGLPLMVLDGLYDQSLRKLQASRRTRPLSQLLLIQTVLQRLETELTRRHPVGLDDSSDEETEAFVRPIRPRSPTRRLRPRPTTHLLDRIPTSRPPHRKRLHLPPAYRISDLAELAPADRLPKVGSLPHLSDLCASQSELFDPVEYIANTAHRRPSLRPRSPGPRLARRSSGSDEEEHVPLGVLKVGYLRANGSDVLDRSPPTPMVSVG